MTDIRCLFGIDWMCMSSSAWAAWAQAFFSAFAIWWTGQHALRQREHVEKREREARSAEQVRLLNAVIAQMEVVKESFEDRLLKTPVFLPTKGARAVVAMKASMATVQATPLHLIEQSNVILAVGRFLAAANRVELYVNECVLYKEPGSVAWEVKDRAEKNAIGAIESLLAAISDGLSEAQEAKISLINAKQTSHSASPVRRRSFLRCIVSNVKQKYF